MPESREVPIYPESEGEHGNGWIVSIQPTAAKRDAPIALEGVEGVGLERRGGYEPSARVGRLLAFSMGPAARRSRWFSTSETLRLKRRKGGGPAGGGAGPAAGQALQRRGGGFRELASGGAASAPPQSNPLPRSRDKPRQHAWGQGFRNLKTLALGG